MGRLESWRVIVVTGGQSVGSVMDRHAGPSATFQPPPEQAGAIVKRSLILALIGLGLVLVTGILALHYSDRRTIYTPAEVYRNLTVDPASWAGRTVWVRGIALGGQDTGAGIPTHWSDQLVPPSFTPGPLDGEDILVIAPQRMSALLDALYHIPYAQAILPHPQRPRYGRVAVYQLTLQDLSKCTPTPAMPRCIMGVVLNAQGWDQ